MPGNHSSPTPSASFNRSASALRQAATTDASNFQSNSPQIAVRDDGLKPRGQVRRPDRCSIAECSAIALYEKELERHRATVASLRDSILRETEMLYQKDELILQKDILAKESEHRLLNGLQLIKSMLAMQSRATANPESAAQLKAAANRVSILSRVHQHLHAIDTLEKVEFKQYLERLCRDLSEMVTSEARERMLSVEGTELTIPRATATPLAFIASELITNSIKYATGRITVSLQATPDGYAVLAVSDDGPGLTETFDPAATKGLGMQIIAALARQINASLQFAKGDHDRGTRFSVVFKHQTTQQTSGAVRHEPSASQP